MKSWINLLILLILLLVTTSITAADQIKIIFSSEVEIVTERIYLNEIATLEGEEELIEDLKRIDFGTAPLLGGSFSLSREMILSHLTYNGVDLDQIELVGLPIQGVIVKRASQLLDHQLVLDEVYAYIYNQLFDFPGEIEINLKRELNNINLPLGSYSVEIGSVYNNRLYGNVSIPVKIILAGKEYTRLTVNLEVKLYDQAFIPIKNLERLTVITSEMIEERFIDITNCFGRVAKTLDEIVGKELKRSLRVDTIILAEHLRDPELIHRNDQIILEAQYGAVKVQALGKALQSGAKGEKILVENLSSRKKVQAIVIDVGLARVLVN